MIVLKPRGVRLAHKLDCPTCGYVRGATTGYDKLTKQERAFLESMGCVIEMNAIGEEIARLGPRDSYSCARGVLHHVYCERKNRFERVTDRELMA